MCKIDKLPIINGFDFTTMHLWDGGYSTNINVCGIWRENGRSSSFQKGISHIYTLRLC